MRRAAALVILLALASCGGSNSKKDDATAPGAAAGTSGATGTAKPKGSPESGFEEVQSKHPQLPALSGGAGFDRSMVRVSFVNTSNPFKVRSAVVYFVSGGSAAGRLAQAKACVRAYLAKAPSAYCFAFSSEQAFRYSKVRPKPPASMVRACWSAYWGKPKGRRPIGSASNPALKPLHCPRQ